jgi:hypothetical protein
MRKALPITLLLALCLAIPLMAGDEKAAGEMPMAPPAPLDESVFGWMVGEWEGWSESPMGKSEDWMTCRMGLGGQFLIMEYKSKTPMGDYEGFGMLTMQGDEVRGHWFDNGRSMSEGSGTIDGTKTTITWTSQMGTSTRITDLVDGKMVATMKMEMGGQKMEGRSEMTRVKHMGKGN